MSVMTNDTGAPTTPQTNPQTGGRTVGRTPALFFARIETN
jgi:hypothetical protein